MPEKQTTILDDARRMAEQQSGEAIEGARP
jgi:hypothetical protein